MLTTLTIKRVPRELAERLRQRAAANRRSLQQELLLIIEQAAEAMPAMGVSEPAPAYRAQRTAKTKAASKSGTGQQTGGRLSLDALWQRARKLGAPMPSESADLIRRDRDARHGH